MSGRAEKYSYPVHIYRKHYAGEYIEKQNKTSEPVAPSALV